MHLHPDNHLPDFDHAAACVGLFHVTHRLFENGVDVYRLRKQDERIDYLLTFVRAGLRLQSVRCIVAGIDALQRAGDNYLHDANADDE